MAENKTLEHLPEVRAAMTALSPEDREVLAAVQASPFKLTAPEQFKEFADNIDYFVFEPNIHDLNDDTGTIKILPLLPFAPHQVRIEKVS